MIAYSHGQPSAPSIKPYKEQTRISSQLSLILILDVRHVDKKELKITYNKSKFIVGKKYQATHTLCTGMVS